jgi:type I restriction enzyme R subunit
VTSLTESVVEDAALAWLDSRGYAVVAGLRIAPGEPQAERVNYGQVVLEDRLRQGLARLNKELPAEALDEAFRKLTRPEGPSLVAWNHAIHRMLVDGVTVEYRRSDGSIAGAQARVLDFDDPDNNDWLAVNQFTVSENLPAATGAAQAGKHTRRADLVVFVNGLPLAVLELKNPADEEADIWTAFRQFQTYKHNGVDRVLVQKVADILAGFGGMVYVIPGNHDPLVPGSVWEHPAWKSMSRSASPVAV